MTGNSTAAPRSV